MLTRNTLLFYSNQLLRELPIQSALMIFASERPVAELADALLESNTIVSNQQVSATPSSARAFAFFSKQHDSALQAQNNQSQSLLSYFKENPEKLPKNMSFSMGRLLTSELAFARQDKNGSIEFVYASPNCKDILYMADLSLVREKMDSEKAFAMQMTR